MTEKKDNDRVWCGTCGQYERPSDPDHPVVRVLQHASPCEDMYLALYQSQHHEYAQSDCLHSPQHHTALHTAGKKGSPKAIELMIEPSLSFKPSNPSSPHRPQHSPRDITSHHPVSKLTGDGDENDERTKDSCNNDQLYHILGKPSMEVIKRPSILPFLDDDALSCLTCMTRTNEVLRNFQDAGAEEQSAELFRYVPPEIGVYTNNTHEEVPDSSLTKVPVLAEADKLLHACVGILSRAQHGFQRATQHLLAKDKKLIQNLTNENAELRETIYKQAQEIDELSLKLSAEQRRHQQVLYTWPSLSNDSLVMDKLRSMQHSSNQLQAANEELLLEVRKLKQENQELQTELYNAAAHTKAGATNKLPTCAGISGIKSKRNYAGPSSGHKLRQSTQSKVQTTINANNIPDQSNDSPNENQVNVYRGIVGNNLATAAHADPQKPDALQQPRKVATRHVQSASDRLAKIPDLKLACLFQMYIAFRVSQVMVEEANVEFRLVRRRLDLVVHRINQWRDNHIADWGMRLQQLTAIQDQLVLLVAALDSDSRSSNAIQNGQILRCQFQTRLQSANMPLTHKRRSTLTLGKASEKYWKTEVASSLETSVDNSWIVTPQSLALQANKANRFHPSKVANIHEHGRGTGSQTSSPQFPRKSHSRPSSGRPSMAHHTSSWRASSNYFPNENQQCGSITMSTTQLIEALDSAAALEDGTPLSNGNIQPIHLPRLP